MVSAPGRSIEYCPDEFLSVADGFERLQGKVLKMRMSGFSYDYTVTMLENMIGPNILWLHFKDSPWPKHYFGTDPAKMSPQSFRLEAASEVKEPRKKGGRSQSKAEPGQRGLGIDFNQPIIDGSDNVAYDVHPALRLTTERGNKQSSDASGIYAAGTLDGAFKDIYRGSDLVHYDANLRPSDAALELIAEVRSEYDSTYHPKKLIQNHQSITDGRYSGTSRHSQMQSSLSNSFELESRRFTQTSSFSSADISSPRLIERSTIRNHNENKSFHSGQLNSSNYIPRVSADPVLQGIPKTYTDMNAVNDMILELAANRTGYNAVTHSQSTPMPSMARFNSPQQTPTVTILDGRTAFPRLNEQVSESTFGRISPTAMNAKNEMDPLFRRGVEAMRSTPPSHSVSSPGLSARSSSNSFTHTRGRLFRANTDAGADDSQLSHSGRLRRFRLGSLGTQSRSNLRSDTQSQAVSSLGSPSLISSHDKTLRGKKSKHFSPSGPPVSHHGTPIESVSAAKMFEGFASRPSTPSAHPGSHIFSPEARTAEFVASQAEIYFPSTPSQKSISQEITSPLDNFNDLCLSLRDPAVAEDNINQGAKNGQRGKGRLLNKFKLNKKQDDDSREI